MDRTIELLKEIKGLLINKPLDTDKWIGIHEASEYCNCSSTTLRRAIKKGDLDASNKLGKTLFKKSSLENFLNG